MPALRRVRWKSVLLIGAITLVVLELVLQGMAGVAHWVAKSRGSVETASNLIVCVGDSYTWGQGASTPDGSYPNHLQRMLRAEYGDDWSVANRGRMGRNSEQAFAIVDQALKEFEPRALFLMLGVNDAWANCKSVADLVEDDAAALETGDEFRWEYRTWRMIKIMTGGQELFRNEPSAAEAADETATVTDPGSLPESDDPLLGRWMLTANGHTIWFKPNGNVQFGTQRLEWRRVPDGIRLGPVGSPHLPVEFREGKAYLNAGDGIVHELAEAGSVQPWMFRHAVSERLYDEANRIAGELRANGLEVEPGSQIRLLCGLAERALEQGEEALARQKFDEARAMLEAHGEPHHVTAVSFLASKLQEDHLGLEIARDALERFPGDPKLWERCAQLAGHCLEPDEGQRVIESAMEHVTDPSARVRLWCWRAAFAKGDRDLMAEILVRLHGIDPEHERVLQQWRWRVGGGTVTREQLSAACERLGIQPDSIEGAIQTAFAERDGWLTTLEANLTAIIRRCERDRVPVVLADYPFRNDELIEVLDKVSKATGAARISMHTAFPKREELRAPLFAADGHCNELGYEIVAQQFFEAAKALIGD